MVIPGGTLLAFATLLLLLAACPTCGTLAALAAQTMVC